MIKNIKKNLNDKIFLFIKTLTAGIEQNTAPINDNIDKTFVFFSLSNILAKNPQANNITSPIKNMLIFSLFVLFQQIFTQIVYILIVKQTYFFEAIFFKNLIKITND